jgi:DNA repair photolyase
MSAGITIRETPCKTILNRSTIGDYSLNCYTGCEHGCVYCYARFMERFHPHREPWGKFVDVKTNAVEVLERQLRRAKPGSVFVSSACDGWQPLESERKLTRECMRLLIGKGFEPRVLTKNALVIRDLDILSGGPATVGITIATIDERLRALWEPRASSLNDRISILARAREAGISTSIMFAPLLPFLSDTQAVLNSMFALAAEHKVETVLVDALNPRPRVWTSIAPFLNRHFPDLTPRYGEVLFNQESRKLYLDELRERVNAAARKARISDCVEVCF